MQESSSKGMLRFVTAIVESNRRIELHEAFIELIAWNPFDECHTIRKSGGISMFCKACSGTHPRGSPIRILRAPKLDGNVAWQCSHRVDDDKGVEPVPESTGPYEAQPLMGSRRRFVRTTSVYDTEREQNERVTRNERVGAHALHEVQRVVDLSGLRADDEVRAGDGICSASICCGNVSRG